MVGVADGLPRPADGLAMFRVGRAAAIAPLVTYFDATLTADDIDVRSSALAVDLRGRGIGPGDRLGVLSQNDPAFVVAVLAAWKIGGIAVPVNPMYTQRELAFLLMDTGARALVCVDDSYVGAVTEVVEGGDTDIEEVVLVDPLAERLVSEPPTATGFAEHSIHPDDPALLMYTSGTTGVPKAAVITHANVTAGAEIYRRWMSLTADDVILGVSPLFHITGMIGHVAASFRTGAQLVLAHRFDADLMVAELRRRRPTFIVATISALVAIADASNGPTDFESVRCLETGGAPVSRAVADAIESRTGTSLGILYGLTETTSPAIATPLGEPAPVDDESGAMAVGIPMTATRCRIVDDDGTEVPADTVGEIELRGPQVISRYWHPDDAADLVEGALRTGDIGFADSAGRIYLIDRRKDMITTAGYKVWPREVEEVLARHPAVAEAVVVGIPDTTRGEAVSAFVTLRSGQFTTPRDLMDHTRAQLAAFKRPRRVSVVDALPKTASGKVMRRELRDRRVEP